VVLYLIYIMSKNYFLLPPFFKYKANILKNNKRYITAKINPI
jgi:hypothetical protein